MAKLYVPVGSESVMVIIIYLYKQINMEGKLDKIYAVYAKSVCVFRVPITHKVSFLLQSARPHSHCNHSII